MSESLIFPGERIASIEEFEAGKNVFDDGEFVRSSVVGTKNIDKADRMASVLNPKLIPVPKVGDVVIGTVAAVMSSMIAVTIRYINGNPVNSNIECICSTRNIRRKNVALVNDVIALRVINHLNGTIHAIVDEPELGVLFTKCRKCGGKVVLLRDAVKCTECAWIDERVISSNFGKTDFLRLIRA